MFQASFVIVCAFVIWVLQRYQYFTI